jgi:hypothetical protein
MGWYLGHFPGAKHVRNELVHINSLADVEHIIRQAIEHAEQSGDDAELIGEDIQPLNDPELNATCAL